MSCVVMNSAWPMCNEPFAFGGGIIIVNADLRGSKINDSDLPEFNDEFVKKLGKFESIEDFKSRLKENILNEKKLRNKDKKRAEVIEGVLKETKIDIPEILTESELEKMLLQLKTDVENAKMDFKTYLIKSGKTEEKLREEWKPSAEKKAKVQLILNEIAEKEKLHPTDEEIEHECSADSS